MIRCRVCRGTSVTKHYRKGKWTYWKCATCDLLFLYPEPDSSALKRHYQSFSYGTGFANESMIRKTAKETLYRLRELNDHVNTIIDIGSSAGFLLDEAKKIGLDPTGIEPSVMLANYARSTFGVHVINTEFSRKLAARLAFKGDAIIMSHVLEHITDPTAFLQVACACLNSSGILIVETPNTGSWLHFFEQERFTFLTPPDHVCLYSDKTMRYLLANIGSRYKIVRTETYSDPTHCRGVLQKIKTKLGPPPVSRRFKTCFVWLSGVKRILLLTITELSTWGNRGSIIRWYIRKT